MRSHNKRPHNNLVCAKPLYSLHEASTNYLQYMPVPTKICLKSDTNRKNHAKCAHKSRCRSPISIARVC